MYQLSGSTQAALDYNSTIIGALELSEKKWVLDDWVGNYSEERPHQDRRLSKPEWRTRSDSRRRPSDQVPATTVKLKGLMPNQYVRHMQRPDANAGSSPVRYARHSHSLCFREIKAKMLDQQESQRRAVG
jgi:hypothetical protein